MKTSPCRGCGKPIVWAVTPEGKKIPLDPRAAVYRVSELPVTGVIGAVRSETHMVSHFATCTKASTFSGSRNPRDLTTPRPKTTA